MSGRFRVTLPPSYHFQNSLQDEQPYFYVSLDDHLKFHIHYMFLVFLAWLIRARIYHVHQNFLVEIAAMDILEDHSLRKVGRDSYSCFERIELSNIIACNFLLWTHVWDSCFFFFSFSYSIHTMFSTTLLLSSSCLAICVRLESTLVVAVRKSSPLCWASLPTELCTLKFG